MKLERLKALKIVSALAVLGTLFAGYLAFFKAITGTCALGESCPYVLGLPACVYGFVMFLSMAAVAVFAVTKGVAESWPERVIRVVAVAGALFAGWLSLGDVGPWLQSGGSYALYLPSCVYGLVFYIAILVVSSDLVNRADSSPKPNDGPPFAEPPKTGDRP
jgi:uncharacterized membrane protein